MDQSAVDVGSVLALAETRVASGDVLEAVDLLVEANRADRQAPVEERLVELRHAAVAAGIAARPGRSAPSAVAPDDPFDQPGIPEVRAEDLTVDLLGAALAHRGSLIVRSLFSPDTAQRLHGDVRRAVAAAGDFGRGASVADTTPWYVPFEAADGYSFGEIERFVADTVGGVLSVESPRTLFDVIEAFEAAGVGGLLEEYLGEWPVLSAKKSTLRHATPASPNGWHQDGAFLGAGTRTVNVWTSLSHCGVDAPGIEVFARAFDGIVETGTGSARFDWSVSEELAEAISEGDIVRPVFAPGDALFFNQLTLHRTGVDASMTKDRYAIESWFFAGSTYPYEQVPILF